MRLQQTKKLMVSKGNKKKKKKKKKKEKKKKILNRRKYLQTKFLIRCSYPKFKTELKKFKSKTKNTI